MKKQEKHEGIPEDMYREHILELYKSPSNFGTIEKATHSGTEYNSLCGDEITIHILSEKGKVKDVKFSGSGCVISMVSSSLLTDKIKGMSFDDVRKMNKDEILELLKVKITPGRIKCALLPLEAAKKALK